MRSLSTSEWTVLVSIVVYSFIPVVGGLIRMLELAGGPAIVPMNPRALAAPLPIVLHIVCSIVFCIAGALQFLPGIRRNHPSVHRHVGRAAAISGIGSAVTGVWMTHFFMFPDRLQDDLLYWVRMLLGPLMVGLIVGAVVAIRSRNVVRHGAWMLRAYAIGQGASTQAFLSIGWVIATGTEPMGPLRDSLMVSAWVLNLVVAEILIGRLLARHGSFRVRRAG